MSWLEAMILGTVQGITEFLPVSSSAHLVIVQQLMGVSGDVLTFDAIIHFGSLLAVIWVYRGELLLIVRSLFASGGTEETRQGRRLLLMLIGATLPVVIVGFTLRDAVAEAFSSVYVSCLMLVVTGILLWVADARRGAGGDPDPGWRHVWWMGVAQALAVFPGLSRSGVTIGTGVLTGMTKEAAARFSFLMSIPTLAGATLLELETLLSSSGEGAIDPSVVVVGAAAAAVTSYAAINVLLRFLRAGSLRPFAYYTWCLAAAVLVISIGSV